MKEIRIDVTKQTPEEIALANEQAQLIFRFNHTMPGTSGYDELMHRIFPTLGEGSMVSTPLTAVYLGTNFATKIPSHKKY